MEKLEFIILRWLVFVVIITSDIRGFKFFKRLRALLCYCMSSGLFLLLLRIFYIGFKRLRGCSSETVKSSYEHPRAIFPFLSKQYMELGITSSPVSISDTRFRTTDVDKIYLQLWCLLVHLGEEMIFYQPIGMSEASVCKMLAHCLFHYAKYSVWVDSESQFKRDPLRVLEALLWPTNFVLAISKYLARSSVYDEAKAVGQKKKATLEKVDVQWTQYLYDGLPEGQEIQ